MSSTSNNSIHSLQLWPNLGRAQDVASRHAEQILQLCIGIANGKMERARAAARLKAAQFVLAIAGVRPVENDEGQSDGGDVAPPPIIVSVKVGGVPASEPVDVIDGQARVSDEARVPMQADTGTLVLPDSVTAG